MSNRHIGIIGGAGFAGLNIAAEALALGHAVTILDRAPPPSMFAARHAAAFVPIDVEKPETLEAIAELGLDVLIHGAAITAGAARDAREPERVLGVNLLGFVAVLRAARDAGIPRIVNLSSVAAYGAAGARHDPMIEDETPNDPRTLYAVSKFASETVGRRLGELWSLDVRTIRLSSLYGPWERATGVRDTLSPHVQLLRLAEAGDAALLPHAGARDWTFAPDAARAVLGIALHERPAHGLHHVSCCEKTTVLAFAEALRSHWPEFACRIAAPGEAPNVDLQIIGDRGSLANDRLRADLPGLTFTPFKEAARLTAEWWQSVQGAA